MQSQLDLQRSGTFHKLTKPLTPNIVRAAFSRAAKGMVGQSLLRSVREPIQLPGISGHCSILVYRTEREPPFLNNSTVIDVSHAFIILVEIGEVLAIYRHIATDPAAALDNYTVPIPHSTMNRIFSTSDSVYEELSLQNMSVSNHGIRSKSVTAGDLRASLNRLLMGRSITRRARYREGEDTFAVAPATSKLTKLDQRVDFNSLLQWTSIVASEIANPRTHDSFLDGFARGISLHELDEDISPAGILFLTDRLEEDIQGGKIRRLHFCRPGTATAYCLDSQTQSDVLRRLRQAFTVKDGEYGFSIHEDSSRIPLGYLLRNEKSFTVESRWLQAILLETIDGDMESLQRYINLRRDVLISFTDPHYVYFKRQLYEDRKISQMARSLVSVFDTSISYAGVTSEKGTFATGQVAFTNDSLFQAIESTLVGPDDYCLCDDLGDEWADYVILSPRRNPPILSFCHAKHKDESLSASSFQDVIGQALKNLGNMAVPPERFEAKISGWDQDTYNSSDGIATSISRIRQGTEAELSAAYAELQLTPNCVRRACLMVTFLSKSEFEAQVTLLENGDAVRPNVVQLIWILSAFVSTCLEAGVQPHIYTPP